MWGNGLTFSSYSWTNLVTRLIIGIKAQLPDTHLVIPRSRLNTKVTIWKKQLFSGALVFHKHILLNLSFPGLLKAWIVRWRLNPLPDNKILALSKWKAFADNNFSGTQMVQFFSDRVENVVGNGEKAGFQHFLLFQQGFQKVFFQGHKNSVLF